MRIEEEIKPVIRVFGLWIAMSLFILGTLLLIWRLFNVQVVESSRYGRAQHSQSSRHVYIPALRGRILDRTGIVLADNRVAYSVVIYCRELRQPGAWANTIAAIDSLIDELAARLGLPRTVTRKQVARHVRESLPMPLEVWRDVDYRTLAYLSEWAGDLPGVEVLPMSRRIYPLGTLAAHVIGSVGASRREADDGRTWHYRLPEVQGRSGIEAAYDRQLSGTGGEDDLRVDSRGYSLDRLGDDAEAESESADRKTAGRDRRRRKARPGSDVVLTLDVKLQMAAESALRGRAGAVVALDPRNGDVLVLASGPSYDLNEMVPPMASEFYKGLLDNPDRPLINRAIQAQYAPGSVFKPFVAIAALERSFNPYTLYACTGIYTDYRCRLRCANRYGHGELDLRQALMKSCNPYFCTVGTEIGIDAIAATSRQAGFGLRTGIDIAGEADGNFPTPEWKKRRFGTSWLPSDTAQVSIGQGAMTATPLQVAHAIGALAMGGHMYRPRLVAFGNTKGDLQRRLPWAHDSIRAVIDGMEMVVSSGTGQKMQVEGISVAGKTGTAEYLDRGQRRKHVWCAAFAPVENPELVVVAMLDNGIGGGRDAGPVIQKVLASYFHAKAVHVRADEEMLQD